MKKLLVRYLFLCVFIFLNIFSQSLFSQNIPDAPQPAKLFVDYVKLVSANDANVLEQQLNVINIKSKNQIAVVILDNIGDYEISDYALALGRKWGVGNKETNSGLLILIVKDITKIWMATGYGLEKYLPDIVCKRIIENNMKPYFKKGQFSVGIQSAILEVVEKLRQNYDGTDQSVINFYDDFLNQNGNVVNDNKRLSSKENLGWGFGIFVFIIVMAIIISRFLGGGGGGMFIGGTGFGSNRGGGFGSSGGGFGGGSFGGGGAGGNW